MTEDNGDKLETPKTPEQLLIERAERFAKDPESFVETRELVLAVKHTPQGLATMIGGYGANDIILARGRLDFEVDEVLRMIRLDARVKEAQNKKILVPGGNNPKKRFFH
jgi:hypothetical protein